MGIQQNSFSVSDKVLLTKYSAQSMLRTTNFSIDKSDKYIKNISQDSPRFHHSAELSVDNCLIDEPISAKNSLIFNKNGARTAEVRRLWRSADAVCFDVDSTVCQNEAIDDFAEFLGKSEEVAACTRDAMTGQITFREALERRLDLMQPTREKLMMFKQMHAVCLTPGIVELVETLQRRHVDVYLVSGGFRIFIRPVAELLGISVTNIFANEILFDANGHYVGFDRTELTSDSGSKSVGKAGVCGLLKASKNYETIIMVGDGATDAEASPPANAFIGFGGNQVRDTVRKLTDWYVMHFDELRQELLDESDGIK